MSSGPIFHIVQRGYPAASLIVFVLLIAPLPFALANGWLAQTGKIGRTLAAFLVATLAVILHNQWENDLVVAGLFLSAAAFAVFVHFKGDRVVGMAAIMFAVMGALSFLNARAFFEPAPPAAPTRDLPPLIHIVLDEHSPGGFEDFTHWPRAYARHYHTVNSLPDMLEGYPEKLADAGYDVEIWQSRFLELCDTRWRCTTYDQASLSQLGAMPLKEQAQLLLATYARKRQIIGDLVPVHPEPSAINGLEILDRFSRRTERMKPGEAIIFHAMLPHFPWAYDANCQLKPLASWGYRMRHPAELREPRYREQRACAEKLARQAFRDDAIIVVHGDHSNRIPARADPFHHRTDITDADIRKAFTTLFAMKIPGLPQGRFDEPATVASLLENWDLETYPTGKRETIWLDDMDWVPRREVEMPD